MNSRRKQPVSMDKDNTGFAPFAIFWICLWGWAAQAQPSGTFRLLYKAEGRLDSLVGSLPLRNERLSVRSSADADTWLIELEVLQPVSIVRLEYSFRQAAPSEGRYFCNGYQSWTTSQERTADERRRRLNRLLDPYSKQAGDYAYYDYPKTAGTLHSWSYTWLRQAGKDSLSFWASLVEDQGFTLWIWQTGEERLLLRRQWEGKTLQAGKHTVFHCLQRGGSPKACFDRYAGLLSKMQPGFTTTEARPATGWTSWYYHYTGINEKIILDNLHAFRKAQIPLDFFQIDDGYQRAVGDWLQPNRKFARGMAALADSIHAAGYKAGIWLAPLVAARRSLLFRRHRDWFLCNAKGKPLPVANNVLWKGKYYALDIYRPEVRRHLQAVLDTILHRWNYDMIKVDFLFGAAIAPDSLHSPGEYMSEAMRLIREAAGTEKRVLGCGVPLASAFGLTDYCRVGNDAHLAWEFGILKQLHAAERPSTWSTLTNTVFRSWLSGRMFRNDPDVFILRKKKTNLSAEEKKTLFLVNNLLGELLFTSDNFDEYDEEQRRLFRSMYPLAVKDSMRISVPERDVYVFEFAIGGRRYCAGVNLSERAAVPDLPPGRYYDADSNRIVQTNRVSLPAHASFCWYRLSAAAPDIELLGGKGHIFSGSEYAEQPAWQHHPGDTVLWLDPPAAPLSGAQKAPLFLLVRPEQVRTVYWGEEHKALPVQDFGSYRGVVLDIE